MSLASLPQSDDDRFREAVAATAVGMAILGIDGSWQDLNPALLRLLEDASGPPVAERPGDGTLFDILQPAQVAGLRTDVDALLKGKTAEIDRRITCQRGDSTFDARINLAPIRNADNDPTGLVLHMQEDAGDDPVAALDAMRRQLQAQVDAVAHDLRAPLRSIDNFSSLLVQKVGDGLDASARDHLGRIRGAASRMASLLDGLAELSRAATAPMRPGPVDLSLLVDWVAAEQQDAHPEREFRVTVQPGLAAYGDEHLLKTLLTQLMDNARRFSHDGAPVTVDVAAEETDGLLRVSVRDCGRGFDMRYRHKLFEPFQRLHSGDEGAGDGLGLAIAQRIAERHDGHIDAESDPVAGSVFHIQLPAVRVAGASPGEVC